MNIEEYNGDKLTTNEEKQVNIIKEARVERLFNFCQQIELERLKIKNFISKQTYIQLQKILGEYKGEIYLQ